MKLIAAADKNWAIGKDGELLVRISEDMKNFSAMTIVLTHKKDYNGKGAIVVHSEEELWEELSKYDTESIFVTGGESIYHMLLPYCDTAYITRLDYEYQADTWMPNLDKEENWSIVEKSEERYCFDLIYHFTTYKNAVPELH